MSHISTSPSGTHLPNKLDPAGDTIPAGHANPPINMSRLRRSYRPHPVYDEKVLQITHILLSQVDHTDPADHTYICTEHTYPADHAYYSNKYRSHIYIKSPLRYKRVKKLPHTDPIPAKHYVNKCEVF